MSISVIIDNPETDDERLFIIPVSSEDFFKKVWSKIALDLNLKWIPLFQTGVKIERCDLDQLFNELDLITAFVKENLKNSNGDHLLVRIALMEPKFK